MLLHVSDGFDRPSSRVSHGEWALSIDQHPERDAPGETLFLWVKEMIDHAKVANEAASLIAAGNLTCDMKKVVIHQWALSCIALLAQHKPIISRWY